MHDPSINSFTFCPNLISAHACGLPPPLVGPTCGDRVVIRHTAHENLLAGETHSFRKGVSLFHDEEQNVFYSFLGLETHSFRNRHRHILFYFLISRRGPKCILFLPCILDCETKSVPFSLSISLSLSRK
jgi:hypothetical protein